MSSLARLALALVVAVAAGLGNYAWMWWVQSQHKTFVTAEKPIKQGELIEATSLGDIRIPGQPEEIGETFIPADKGKALLVGMRASRDYRPGDLFTYDQIRMDLPRWKALGPFRLLSVGERVRSGGGYSEGRGSNTVTIAATVGRDGRYDAKTERLLDILAGQGSRDKDGGLKVVAIQLDPPPGNGASESGTSEKSEDAPESVASEDAGLESQVSEDAALENAGELERLQLDANEHGIIVPLRNVESIPEVLVRGDHISFIVAWFDDSADNGSLPNMVGD